MEQDPGCLFAYYQGGAGNINPTSRIQSEMANPDRDYKRSGRLLADTAKHIRDNSPYTYNFSLAYTDGYHGYFPTREAWEYGCYEADIAPGSPSDAEAIAARLLEILTELHG